MTLKKEDDQIVTKCQANSLTSFFLQKFGSENQLSSTTTSELRGFPLHVTAAVEDVRTTLFTDANFEQELRTLSVPFTAGSSNSV